MPMGLMLVEQGGITPAQLREALEGQQRAAEQTGETVRLGEWLVRSGVLGEPALMRALSAQWNCPVFPLASYRPEEVAGAMPRFLSEAFGALPVRAAAGRVLYVAFSGRIDRSLSYALERMTGMRVAAGLARDSEFAGAQAGFLGTPAPATRFLEAASSWVLVRAITERIESERPVEAQAGAHPRLRTGCGFGGARRMARGCRLPGAVEDLLADRGELREEHRVVKIGAQPMKRSGGDCAMSGMTVLIVDDSSVMRKIVERALRQAGLNLTKVLEAGSGREGLEALGRDRPDLIVSDINMPSMDGLEFLRQIQSQGLAAGRSSGDDHDGKRRRTCAGGAGGRRPGIHPQAVHARSGAGAGSASAGSGLNPRAAGKGLGREGRGRTSGPQAIPDQTAER